MGLEPLAKLRVLATRGEAEDRSALIGDVRAVLRIGEVPTEVGDRLGIGPQVPAIAEAKSWPAARTALRITSDLEPVVRWDDLGALAVLAERLSQADIADLPDILAVDRPARPRTSR